MIVSRRAREGERERGREGRRRGATWRGECNEPNGIAGQREGGREGGGAEEGRPDDHGDMLTFFSIIHCSSLPPSLPRSVGLGEIQIRLMMVRPMMQACFGRWPVFASGIIVIILSVQWQSVHIHMWAIVGELLSRVLMIQAWDLVTVVHRQ